MSTPDNSPEPEFAYRAYQSGPGLHTFELMTANGLYVVRDLTSQMWGAFVADMEAAAPGGLESVVAAWTRMRDIDQTT